MGTRLVSSPSGWHCECVICEKRRGYPVAVINAQRRLYFGFPYTVGDLRAPRLPQDKTPRKPWSIRNYKLPQSIQYPPGMEPMQKGGLVVSDWTYVR